MSWKDIIEDTCSEHDVHPRELFSGSRQRRVVACRWEIIRRMRDADTFNGRPVSQCQIARRLGMDHSSVNYALRRLAGEAAHEAKPSAYRGKQEKRTGLNGEQEQCAYLEEILCSGGEAVLMSASNSDGPIRLATKPAAAPEARAPEALLPQPTQALGAPA